MRILGLGDIGKALAEQLRARGHVVVPMRLVQID